MLSRILCAFLISHGLLMAQEAPATVPPPATEPTAAEPTAAEPVAEEAPMVLPEAPAVAPAGGTAIIGPIADGTPSPPPPPPPRLPDFKVKSTATKQIMREESSGVPGLQPVRKQVTATVHLVEDPHLPDPPPPPPPADMNDPAVLARRAWLAAHYQKSSYLSVSATVYDRRRTLLRWYPIGNPEREMTAWSNIDFNYMTGFAKYTHNGRTYSLLMMVGNESTAARARLAQRLGRAYTPPEIPDIPAEGPGFVVTEGDTDDAEAMEIVTGLHELYRVEGARLRAAYEARRQAEIAREAYLRANPPQPQDVTISVWRRDAPATSETTGQGGNP